MSSVESADDLWLAKRCARGDEAALRRIVDCYGGSVYAVALRFLGSREDAEEVVGTVFTRFWNRASQFRGESSLKSFLCRSALNCCKDIAKRRKPMLVLMECPPEPERDEIEVIRDAMLVLEEDDRELLVLYYTNEMSYEEICATLDISYDVLRTRLVRARKRLRELVGVTK